MSYLALSPVSVGVFNTLNVAAMLALAPGGTHDLLPQNVEYPCVLYEVNVAAQFGIGSKPGNGSPMSEIDLRLHVFTKTGGPKAAQTATAKAIELLVADNAISVSGYTVCGLEPFYDETVYLPDEMIAGQRVQEMVSRFRLYVQES